MTKKTIGQGAGQFAPTSQFAFLADGLKTNPKPATTAPPKEAAKTEAKPEVKAKTETRAKPVPAAQTGNENFKVNAFATAPEKKVSTTATYNLDKDVARRLKIHSATINMSASRIVNDLIVGYLAEHEKK